MTDTSPVALITGAARRIGAAIARELHQHGFRILIHCRSSTADANQLCAELNDRRSQSAAVLRADLGDTAQLPQLASQALEHFGRVDALINNASSFYPTPLNQANDEQWDDLFSSNAKAPLFLSQQLAPELQRNQGGIINIADIHAQTPLGNHTIYCMAKSANIMLTKSLAKELAPRVRVNGIAPGAILWPEQEAELDDTGKAKILNQVPLARPGEPQDIAKTVRFLLIEGSYITGQIIAVDGGRSLNH